MCQIKWEAAGHFFPVESKTFIPQEKQKRGQSCSPFLLQLFELLCEYRRFACLGGCCIRAEISPAHTVIQ